MTVVETSNFAAVWNLMIPYLNHKDVSNLSTVSRAYYDFFYSEIFWRDFYHTHYGNPWLIYKIIVRGEIECLQEMSCVYRHEPTSYKSMFKERLSTVLDSEEIVQEKVRLSRDLIVEFQNNQNDVDLIFQALCTLLSVVDQRPDELAAYYHLAMICFVLNNFDGALEIIHIVQEMDANDVACQELKMEIEKIRKGLKGLVIDDHQLTPSFAKIISHIFHVLDRNRDGHLQYDEFVQHLRNVGNQMADLHPNMFYSLIQNYNEEEDLNIGLSLDGFLNLYTEQALHDVEEVKRDLACYGFNV